MEKGVDEGRRKPKEISAGETRSGKANRSGTTLSEK